MKGKRPIFSTKFVEKLFIFNVDVLSMVLYRRRSFETTVKIRLITGSRRLKYKIPNNLYSYYAFKEV